MIEKGTALVTGASSGIGAELARLFARDGHAVVLAARNEGALDALATELREKHGVRARVIACDLASPTAPANLADELQRESIQIDYLVNNAGFGSFGPFWETALERQLEMIQVNVAALTHLTRLLLPAMVSRRRGRVLNVASTAGFQPGPLMAVYYATKAFVLSFSEALAVELEGTGVTVTALCPGPVRTEFQKRAAMEDSGLAGGKLVRFMEPAPVAEAGFRGMMQGKTIVIPGLVNKAGVFSVRLGPRKLVARIVRFIQSKRR